MTMDWYSNATYGSSKYADGHYVAGHLFARWGTLRCSHWIYVSAREFAVWRSVSELLNSPRVGALSEKGVLAARVCLQPGCASLQADVP